MNILVAPNSMKGSLNAFEFADAISAGFTEASSEFQIRKIPLADGGDHTGEVLRRALRADELVLNVKGPAGDEVKAAYFVHNQLAIIEMANASGLKLITPDKMNPMETSSYGTGQLIVDALQKGCSRILLAVGGSATVDGGSGMLEALGFAYIDKNGRRVNGNGKGLREIKTIKFPENIPLHCEIRILCDVNNPLLGPQGAARVFGPQKGATSEMVNLLEEGLRNWSDLISSLTGTRVDNVPGMGAAGGISTGLTAFLNAQLVPGADYLIDLLKVDEAIQWADLVITGEGKIDDQSLSNKAPAVLALHCRHLGKPVIALAGIADLNDNSLFDGIFSIINGPMTVEAAMKNAFELVQREANQLGRFLSKFNNSTTM